MSSTVVRRLFLVVLLAVAISAGCSGENPYDAAQSAETGSAQTTGPDNTVNEFLPERENVTDCFGAVERPNCGSKAKGDWRMYVTLGVLVAGMTFIGWRVVRGVRSRDQAAIRS